MGAFVGFFVGLWNFVLSIAPTVLHTACQLTEGATNTLKLGGGL